MTDNIEAAAFRDIFTRLKANGKMVAPRGQKVIEVEGFTYELPAYARFQTFECRKYKTDYVKNEVLWYLRANRGDMTILDHASMWKGLVNADNSINSNYGHYIFGPVNSLNGDVYRVADGYTSPNTYQRQHISQFDGVLKTLTEDKDSRRASIVILQPHHLLSDTKDVPCTYSMNFRIRDNKLNMSVHMRSQDGIFGMGNDAPAFSVIQEMVFVSLRDTVYPELEMGTYTHTADSFHVYERHFEMLETIVAGDGFTKLFCPQIVSIDEVRHLRGSIHLQYTEGKNSINYNMISAAAKALEAANNMLPTKVANALSGATSDYEFSNWLLSGAHSAEAKRAAASIQQQTSL